MPRWAKVLIWVLVLGVSAGAGAWVASRTDPFPPGVEDPGARGSATPSATGEPSPSAQPTRWRLRIVADASHTFRVGGTCRARWAGSLVLSAEGGQVSGSGSVDRVGPLECDFPVAQLLAESIDLHASGALDGTGGLELRARGIAPQGSEDLSGFRATARSVALTFGSAARDTVTVERSDGVGGRYRTVTRAVLRCVSSC